MNTLITGGTSGLGLALAKELHSRGARVAVIARRNPEIALPFAFIQGDVSDKMSTHRIYAEALNHLERIDLLIHCASALGATPLRLLLDTECEDFFAVLNTNLLGVFRLTKLVVPQMILQGSGVVVNISSDAAVNAYSRWGAYGVSKAALNHMTRTFQTESEGTGVRFLALDPGDMDTPMHQAAVPDADRSLLAKPEDSALRILHEILK